MDDAILSYSEMHDAIPRLHCSCVEDHPLNELSDSSCQFCKVAPVFVPGVVPQCMSTPSNHTSHLALCELLLCSRQMWQQHLMAGRMRVLTAAYTVGEYLDHLGTSSQAEAPVFYATDIDPDEISKV